MNNNQTTTSAAHAFVTRTVINRLNHPKREAKKMSRAESLRAKTRRELQAYECDDVSQTVAFVMLRARAFNAPMVARQKNPGPFLEIWRPVFLTPDISFDLWKRIFSDVRAVLLRNDVKGAKEETAILANFDGPDAPGLVIPTDGSLWAPPLADPETLARFHARIALKRRALFLLIRAAWEADMTRKRNANMRRAVASVKYILAAVTGRGDFSGTSFADPNARRRAMFTLRAYLSAGSVALKKSAPRKHVPLRVVKCLADIPSWGAEMLA